LPESSPAPPPQGAPEESDSPAASAPVSTSKPPNFHITDDVDIGGGGAKTKYRRNVEAIRILQAIEGENRPATADEQRTLALYSGWGGISQVFDAERPEWRTEYAELKALLSKKEYRDAAGSTLNALYERRSNRRDLRRAGADWLYRREHTGAGAGRG
jgi:hypothetical protein